MYSIVFGQECEIMSKNKLRAMLSTVIILSVITLTTSCDILLDGDDSGTASLGSSFTLPTGTVQQLALDQNKEIKIKPWSQGEMTLYVVTLGASEGPEDLEEIVHRDGSFPEIRVDKDGNFPSVTINKPPTETLISTADFNAFPDEQYTVTPEIFSFTLIGGLFNPDSDVVVSRRFSTETSDTFVYWMYVDRDVVATGSKDSEEYDYRELITTDLNLKRGWNRLVYSRSFSDDTVISTEKTGSEPSGTGWFTESEAFR